MKVLRVGTQYTQATFTNSPRLEATFERNFPAVYCYGISLYYSNIVIKGVGIIGLKEHSTPKIIVGQMKD